MTKALLVGGLVTLLVGCGVGPDETSAETIAPADFAVSASPPPELSTFAQQVRTASNSARAAGSKGCGVALQPTQVSEATLNTAILKFVTNYRGVGVTPSPQPTCGKPGFPACANLFQNILFHNDARMGTALHPSGQKVDLMASARRVTVFTSSSPVAATTAGIYNGWLMGVAWFDKQPTCP